MNARVESDSEKNLYNRQNRAIHKARAQLCIELDDCRELARNISGTASISSLSLRQRWELIEILKSKGARVSNPPLPESLMFPGNNHVSPGRRGDEPAPTQESGCSLERQEKPEDVYPNRLAYWEKRFPRRRPGFASASELAWIQTVWELDVDRGSGISGLRKFIQRQTGSLEGGPVCDLSFLRANHVKAVLGGLKAMARDKRNTNQMREKGKEGSDGRNR